MLSICSWRWKLDLILLPEVAGRGLMGRRSRGGWEEGREGGRDGSFSPAVTVTGFFPPFLFDLLHSWLESHALSTPLRHGQQGPPGPFHGGNAPEDVQPGSAGLLCIPLQPL